VVQVSRTKERIEGPSADNPGKIRDALRALDALTPDAPFLALGQTVFWDEPMKAGVAEASVAGGSSRRFVAGVHDTDYFAKLASATHSRNGFAATPHNDTTTKGLWSAAGEFSALFGSETIVTRETLVRAGLRVDALNRLRPGFLDDATEAWGWRGIVSLDEHPPVTADVPVAKVFPELEATFRWALELSVACLAEGARDSARAFADELLETLRRRRAEVGSGSLSDLYRAMAPDFYTLCGCKDVEIETTATTELLRFNRSTAELARFELPGLFLRPETREAARAAYDAAIQGTGLYDLERFGTGAIPFDLVIPGKGRGTLRIGTHGIVVMTAEPQFATPLRSVDSIEALAEEIERAFGKGCALVGKAVTLIGMLAREFVFVFHEGASSYVRHSRAFHQGLALAGHELELNPILRIRYDAWSALGSCCKWLRLPEVFRGAFGVEEVCGPSFAARWQSVAQEQEALLEKLGGIRSPIDLIRFLAANVQGSWGELGGEYEALHGRLERLQEDVAGVQARRRELYDQIRELKKRRVETERERGEQFRAEVFGQSASADALARRAGFEDELKRIADELAVAREAMRDALTRQERLVRDPEVLRIHERRRSIEMEAELKRLGLIRQAVVASRGLKRANHRPSAWWFRLVCTDGDWYRATIDSAEAYLEPLI